jgi:hypothetical protein
MLTNINRIIQARASHHAKAIFRSTRVVRSSFFDQVERATRIGHAFLKSLGKGWSFFKDIHFGWYVLVPVISSTSAFGEAAAILAWGSVFVFLFALIAFALLDSIFGRDVASEMIAHPMSAEFASMPPRRSRATYEPLQSRLTQTGLRRSGVRRMPRSHIVRS